MAIAVSLTYWPLPPPGGGEWALSGFDFSTLHARRLSYAREALWGGEHRVPGWYTREFGGAPFWSNVQSFPLIPTRLPLLLIEPQHAFAAGVQAAALLSALFTYLYCRRLGLGVAGSAAGGFTFAAAGFFAARVRAGHLPLLEAYPALPLLLWLIEVNLQPGRDDRRGWKLLAVAAACASAALAGHPQIPLYALATAGLYLLWRGRSRTGAAVAAAMALGTGLAAVSLYPMALLVERSTRVLALDASANDVALPARRLLALVLPWIDGWPATIHRGAARPFAGYPNVTYFWDTVSYAGILPIAACAVLAARAAIARRPPRGPWAFLAGLGVVSLLLALPTWHEAMRQLPGTLLRSPARLLYLTTFALAMAAAAGIDWAASRAAPRRGWAMAAVAAALALHAVDLGYLHDRAFVVAAPVAADPGGREESALAARVGAQRIAIDHLVDKPYNREIDDAGVFDSIILARPYRALLAVAGAAPGQNVQVVDGSDLTPRALRFMGVNTVIAAGPRADLPRLNTGRLGVHDVPDPLPRASLVPADRAEYLSPEAIHRRLASQDVDLASRLLLPDGAPRPPAGSAPGAAAVRYARPSPDRMAFDVSAPAPSYLRVIETWDPGWRAEVDGAPAPLIPAYDVFMAVPVPAGEHRVLVTFHTPGARAGLAISGVSLALLLALCGSAGRAPARGARSIDSPGPA